jgi:PqqD family protein of HPr-rel-A system
MHASRQAGAECYWSTIGDSTIYWERWGKQYAVFDSLSGETHLLPEYTALVLQKLDEGACTVNALAEAVCAVTGEACDEHLVKVIIRLLQQLQGVGLVEKSAT